jgi:hypothetical protein
MSRHSIGRRLFALGALILIVGSSTCWLTTHGSQSREIGPVSVEPSYLVVNTPTPVTSSVETRTQGSARSERAVLSCSRPTVTANPLISFAASMIKAAMAIRYAATVFLLSLLPSTSRRSPW